MPTCTINGTDYEYAQPVPGRPAEARSWEYGHYPKIRAAVPLTDGGTLTTYARAERWNKTHILARWDDDNHHPHTAWIPAANVEPVTDSEWDIWEYNQCPEKLRAVRWGDRLPGFLLV